MEGGRIFKSLLERYAHIPTLLIAVGYPVYWIELYLLNKHTGVTSFLAPILFFLAVVAYVFAVKERHRSDYSIEESPLNISEKIFIVGGSIFSVAILCIALYAYLMPVHMVQESDVLQYHMTLPRQHLITGSFKHIAWAADDLFLLPMQFALAPYWFVTEIPNKFPHILFLIGLILVSIHLLYQFGCRKKLLVFCLLFALLGSHNIGIQMGTAMLDLAVCYLFLAALDSLLKGRVIFAAIEFTFFVWSKSFFPVQTIFIGAALIGIYYIFKRFYPVKLHLIFDDQNSLFDKNKVNATLKRFFILFLILSLFVGGPFLIKSLHYSETPLFPFLVGVFPVNSEIDHSSAHWASLTASSEYFLNVVRDNYGYGRSFSDFLKHFWLIAVPDTGVNNQFDYPLGLVYLLFVGPFIYYFISSLFKKEFTIIPFYTVLFWLSWWFGSQQSRFLYIPIVLMMICCISRMEAPSKVLLGCILLSLLLNSISVFRANKHMIGKSWIEILRGKDQRILQMNKDYFEKGRKGYVDLEFHDVAYAQFPVRVTKESLPHTLAIN